MRFLFQTGPHISPADFQVILENRLLLQNFTNSLVKDSSAESERVCLALLTALIPIARSMLRRSISPSVDDDADPPARESSSSRPATPTLTSEDASATNNANNNNTAKGSPASPNGGFPQLMVMMATLAGAGRSGRGHAILFKAALEWTILCKNRLRRSDLADVLRGNDDDDDVEGNDAGGAGEGGRRGVSSSKTCLESICCLLSYIGEILGALKLTSMSGEKSEGDGQHDWMMAVAPGVDPDLYYMLEGRVREASNLKPIYYLIPRFVATGWASSSTLTSLARTLPPSKGRAVNRNFG